MRKALLLAASFSLVVATAQAQSDAERWAGMTLEQRIPMTAHFLARCPAIKMLAGGTSSEAMIAAAEKYSGYSRSIILNRLARASLGEAEALGRSLCNTAANIIEKQASQ